MMQSTLAPFVAASLLLVSGSGAGIRSTLKPCERDALIATTQTASSSSLGKLRAGDVTAPSGLSAAERSDLARAQSVSSELGKQRAGDVTLSTRELQIIGVVLLAVILIAIIA
jgi:hypothetical protein